MESHEVNDTIAAISTPTGVGGIAVIRVSGEKALEIVCQAWKGADLTNVPTHTAHYGKYFSSDGSLLDEAVATVFKSPNSFTGEDVVEISVHGSLWIQHELLKDLVNRSVRIAEPGEFTKRAFLNGKIDLTQAEATADLLSAASKAAHDIAIHHIKGSFAREIKTLKNHLINFASLVELELDFSEEDVEFADREKLQMLCEEIICKIDTLTDSYSRGSVLKEGVPVVLTGIPNAGKSSLLNLLLKEDKAIVTEIPGTTRDIIEDTIEYEGVLYRFIDTAGLRTSIELVEQIGIERAKISINNASIIVWVLDPTQDLEIQLSEMNRVLEKHTQKKLIVLINKSDIRVNKDINELQKFHDVLQKDSEFKDSSSYSRNITNKPILFSTKTKQGLTELLYRLDKISKGDFNPEKNVYVTNARHYQALTAAAVSLKRVHEGLKDGISGDFIAQDIRQAISDLSTITGEISSDTLLHSIFSRFCIGK